MSIDINGLSAKELNPLISQAKKRKSTLSRRKPIAVVRKKLLAAAKAEGYSIEELFGSAGAKPARATPVPQAAPRKSTKGYKLGKVAPKYRNPADTSQTWAGRGKPPRWLQTHLDQGRKLEEFLIK